MRESTRLGYRTVLLPADSDADTLGGAAIKVKRVSDALDLLSAVAKQS
jgi:hypothetical protein